MNRDGIKMTKSKIYHSFSINVLKKTLFLYKNHVLFKFFINFAVK
jgi:hypothetical protein